MKTTFVNLEIKQNTIYSQASCVTRLKTACRAFKVSMSWLNTLFTICWNPNDLVDENDGKSSLFFNIQGNKFK